MSLSAPLTASRRPPFTWRPSTRFALASLIGAALVLTPLLALLATALSSSQAAEIWPHLAANVLPTALVQTGLLLAGVGLLSAVLGVGTAWLVTQFEFPGRRHFDWLLVLPLALPTYLMAYIYVEFLGFQGPLQSVLRALTGWRSLRDYWFPDPRSLPGAIAIMAIVLYPYVYLSTRALFSIQGATIVEAARNLGATPGRLFWRIGLPLARPALAAGLTLVLLETLNDIGATEYLGVRSLTLSIYTTWINRGSLPGAAQIACVMLVVVFLLIWTEARLRGQRRFALPVRQPRPLGRRALRPRAALLAAIACSLPVLFGAILPVGYLAAEILRRGLLMQLDAALLRLLANVLLLAGIAAAIVLLLGLGIATASRAGRETWLKPLARLASLGYAVPGTVLALGLLIPIAALDNVLASAITSLSGIKPGLLLIGSGAALVIAYVVRFLTIGIAGVESGLSRVSPRIDDAARALGAGQPEILRRIHWPLMRPAVAAAALLVFVDCLKELPATLLLRPLNLETLATVVYGHASRGVFEDGALAALLIILAGLYPAMLLAKTGTDRAG
ncbi:ABC transporter permease [Bosea sp. TAF32]|uniref:ABC transporter permease n=1 Tax=Bosea sp. TAF32 TaxID=3237482 RepID=UPI003F91D8FF